MDAINGIQLHMNNKIKQFWVVEGDIKGCFDNIPHKRLIHVLRKRIADERLLAVIWSLLKAGYVEDNKLYTPNCGTPQGGICSPLLANIYLHEMDTYWYEHYGNLTPWQKKQRRRKGMGNVTLVRYADDFLILTNGPKTEAYALKEEFSNVLKDLELRLSPSKTLVTHANDGLDFLGFHIHRRPQRLHPERKVIYITPTQRNVARYKDKIRSMLSSTQGDVVNKIRALNRVIKGWGNYYRHVQSSHQRKMLEHWTYWAVWRWLRRKHDLGAKALYARFQTKTPSGKSYLGYKGVYLFDMTRIKFEKYIAHPSQSPYLLDEASLTIQDEQPIALEMWDGTSSQNSYAIHRQDLLAIYGQTCQQCGKQELPGRLHTHHIKARKDGGTDNLMNLILLCQDCHKETTSYGRKRREI
jgi:RNA-directed DNA polymerase